MRNAFKGRIRSSRCLDCNYILDHAPSARCPECGRPFNLADPATFHDGQKHRADWICLIVAIVNPVAFLLAAPVFGGEAVLAPAGLQVVVIAVSSMLYTERHRGRRYKLVAAIVIAGLELAAELILADVIG